MIFHMTTRLFDEDSSLLIFSAVVRSCTSRGDGCFDIVLDRTAFFPEGGGQGADHGTLHGAKDTVHVTDAHESGGEIHHLTDGPLDAGETVEGRVDGARRLAMMQQHSGEHIFSGLVHKFFGYDNVGFHIGSDAVTMDFNGPLNDEDAHRIEWLANEAVWADIPVRAFVPNKIDLEQMNYRSKKAIDGDVRIVQIEGVDTCACCGTHVKHTGSIGQIKLLGVQKYKGGVRVSILCGGRALEHENAMLEQVHRVSTALSVQKHEIADATARLLAERDNLRAQNDALGLRLFDMLAERERESARRVVACDALPAPLSRKAAGKLCVGAQMGLVLIARDDGWNFALASESIDVRPVVKALCGAFGGKGGGPKDMAQGVLSSGSEQEIRSWLRDYSA